MAECTHLDTVEFLDPPAAIEGCEECLATAAAGSTCACARRAATIGCCDNSPSRHMSAHHEATGHPIIRSVEPGEDWSWCFVDQLMFRLRGT